jgi:hypothetical protein
MPGLISAPSPTALYAARHQIKLIELDESNSFGDLESLDAANAGDASESNIDVAVPIPISQNQSLPSTIPPSSSELEREHVASPEPKRRRQSQSVDSGATAMRSPAKTASDRLPSPDKSLAPASTSMVAGKRSRKAIPMKLAREKEDTADLMGMDAPQGLNPMEKVIEHSSSAPEATDSRASLQESNNNQAWDDLEAAQYEMMHTFSADGTNGPVHCAFGNLEPNAFFALIAAGKELRTYRVPLHGSTDKAAAIECLQRVPLQYTVKKMR